jgi:hypothetical protein
MAAAPLFPLKQAAVIAMFIGFIYVRFLYFSILYSNTMILYHISAYLSKEKFVKRLLE